QLDVLHVKCARQHQRGGKQHGCGSCIRHGAEERARTARPGLRQLAAQRELAEPVAEPLRQLELLDELRIAEVRLLERLFFARRELALQVALDHELSFDVLAGHAHIRLVSSWPRNSQLTTSRLRRFSVCISNALNRCFARNSTRLKCDASMPRASHTRSRSWSIR